MAITIKNEREIGLMREASQAVVLVTPPWSRRIAPGVTDRGLDDIARDTFTEMGATSLFLGHLGFTGRICASINEEIVHGIPGKRVLREGDIISVDVGARVEGYCGDSAWTYGLASIIREAKQLLAAPSQHSTRESNRRGGKPDWAPSATRSRRLPTGTWYGLVREYGGHGIGRKMWEEPHVSESWRSEYRRPRCGRG